MKRIYSGWAVLDEENEIILDDVGFFLIFNNKENAEEERKAMALDYDKLGIRKVRIAAGAGFVIPIAGKIELMPGLPKQPAAENIDIDEDGHIKGLI